MPDILRRGTARYDAATRTITVTTTDGDTTVITQAADGYELRTLAEHGWARDPGERDMQVTPDHLGVVVYAEPPGRAEQIQRWVRDYGDCETHVRAQIGGGQETIRYLVVTDPETMILEGDALVLEAPDPGGVLYARAGAVRRAARPAATPPPLTLAMLTTWPPPPAPAVDPSWLLTLDDIEDDD